MVTSWVMSWLMFAICVPWFPASVITEPSMINCMPPFGCAPLEVKFPIGPLLICVTALFHCAFPSPLFIAIPGIRRISSAASRPWMAIWLTSVLFRVVLATPLSVGTGCSAAATSTVSLTAPTFKAMFVTERLSC